MKKTAFYAVVAVWLGAISQSAPAAQMAERTIGKVIPPSAKELAQRKEARTEPSVPKRTEKPARPAR